MEYNTHAMQMSLMSTESWQTMTSESATYLSKTLDRIHLRNGMATNDEVDNSVLVNKQKTLPTTSANIPTQKIL